MRFKKGELTREAYEVIMRDIELLQDCRLDKEDFDYHHDLVVNNLKDVFGLSEFETMSDDELLLEHQQLDEMIYKVECYGVNDLKRLNLVCEEIGKRGIEIYD